jgi:hypothetical protein
MLCIKELSRHIKEEANDADKYVTLALEYKEKDRALADTYYTLAGEELKHLDMLHAQVTRIISSYRATKGEPPAPMMAIYEYLHEEMIENVAEVKVKLGMYKGA